MKMKNIFCASHKPSDAFKAVLRRAIVAYGVIDGSIKAICQVKIYDRGSYSYSAVFEETETGSKSSHKAPCGQTEYTIAFRAIEKLHEVQGVNSGEGERAVNIALKAVASKIAPNATSITIHNISA